MNSTLKAVINFPFKVVGLKIHRDYGFHWRNAKKIIKEAKANNLSVGEYIDENWGEPGLGRNVFNQMKKYGISDYKEPRILEVGAGTGRHLEKWLSLTKPEKYEVYELDEHWAEYLKNEFNIVRQPTNGSSLDFTSDASIDILTAHGVFDGPIEFMGCMKYLSEFFRVIKPGGFMVFDIFSEECLDPKTFDKWVSDIPVYAKILPAELIKQICIIKGYDFLGSFKSPVFKGFDGQYLIFKKKKI